MKLVYSNHEKLKEDYENNLCLKIFEHTSGGEKISREWYGRLKIRGGKFYDSAIKKIYEKISGLAKD